MIVHYDQLNVENSDGIMLQIYGSGGPSKGSVAWAWSDHEPLTFPVSQRDSVRYFVPWDKLPPPYQVAESKRYLRFHVGTTLTGSHYMVLDRLHFYGEALVEDIQPTVERQEIEPVDATFFYGGLQGLDSLR